MSKLVVECLGFLKESGGYMEVTTCSNQKWEPLKRTLSDRQLCN